MSGDKIHEARLLFTLLVGSSFANSFKAKSCFKIMFSLAIMVSILLIAKSVNVSLLVSRESSVDIGIKPNWLFIKAKI